PQALLVSGAIPVPTSPPVDPAPDVSTLEEPEVPAISSGEVSDELIPFAFENILLDQPIDSRAESQAAEEGEPSSASPDATIEVANPPEELEEGEIEVEAATPDVTVDVNEAVEIDKSAELRAASPADADALLDGIATNLDANEAHEPLENLEKPSSPSTPPPYPPAHLSVPVADSLLALAQIAAAAEEPVPLNGAPDFISFADVESDESEEGSEEATEDQDDVEVIVLDDSDSEDLEQEQESGDESGGDLDSVGGENGEDESEGDEDERQDFPRGQKRRSVSESSEPMSYGSSDESEDELQMEVVAATPPRKKPRT
ncbi:hypothetical protein P7C70_g9108, partial [Phenoliferia sp. Uapishka_3]